MTCKTCDYYHEEHCVNYDSEQCTEPVSEDYSCEWWEEKDENN